MRILRITNTRFLSAHLRHRALCCVLSCSLPAIGAKKLHKLSEHLLEVLKRCMLRVARCARIRSCGLAEERKILFLELLDPLP